MNAGVPTKTKKRSRGESTRLSYLYWLKCAALRLCVFAGTILLVTHASIAQTGRLGWVWQNPLPQGNPLNSISFARDKETGFAVGSDDTILHTEDGGFH
ncbi:MAG: hypothetical protein ABI999_09110, partial [Acidobacteriota bacterium]